MSEDDPFGAPPSSDRTVIRPNPGGRRVQAATVAPQADRAPPRSERAVELGAPSGASLAAQAAPILSLVGQLKTTPYRGDVGELQQRLLRQLRAFQDGAARAGANAEQGRAAAYALCATIDDVVLNTPWGRASGWATNALVLQVFNETNAGKRLYDLLERLEREPGANIGLLELIYYCLAFGFEGEMRVHPRGASELARVREALYRAIRAVRGEFERELSPRWRGVVTERKLAQSIPPWVSIACAAAVLATVYTGFSLALSRASDQTFRDIAALPPKGPVVLPPPPPPEAGPGLRDRVALRLQAEERGRQVEVTGDALFVNVRILGAGMFASGSATIDSTYAPLLQKVAKAIEAEPGRVTVVGHTDNQPPRLSARFPSNFELSLARALSVEKQLAGMLPKDRTLGSDGRGDTDPLVPNTTLEGRAANRRIEITLQQTGR